MGLWAEVVPLKGVGRVRLSATERHPQLLPATGILLVTAVLSVSWEQGSEDPPEGRGGDHLAHPKQS